MTRLHLSLTFLLKLQISWPNCDVIILRIVTTYLKQSTIHLLTAYIFFQLQRKYPDSLRRKEISRVEWKTVVTKHLNMYLYIIRRHFTPVFCLLTYEYIWH